MKTIPLLGFSIVALLLAHVAAQPAKSVNEGVYTATQADRGAAVFKETCTACHEPSRFIGTDFLSVWTGKPLHALFDQMSATMPEDNPGSLKPQQYADIIAYFLKLNDYPAGASELPEGADALKVIAFDKRAK